MLALAVLALVVIDIVIILGYQVIQHILNKLHVEKVLNRDNPEEISGVSIEVSLL